MLIWPVIIIRGHIPGPSSKRSVPLSAIEEPLVLSISCFSEAQPLSFRWSLTTTALISEGRRQNACKGTWTPIWICLRDYRENVARWVCAGDSPGNLGSASLSETPNKPLASKLCYFSAGLNCSLLRAARGALDHIAACSPAPNVAP